jgi:hypothetical protein
VLASAPVGPNDEDFWYLVKSATGLLGWTSAKELSEKTEGLPWAG